MCFEFDLLRCGEVARIFLERDLSHLPLVLPVGRWRPVL